VRPGSEVEKLLAILEKLWEEIEIVVASVRFGLSARE
jgi:hypothetical protein